MASGGASRIREMLARLEGRVKARTVDRPWFRWVVWTAVGLALLIVAMSLVTGIGALATQSPVDNPLDLLLRRQLLADLEETDWNENGVVDAERHREIYVTQVARVRPTPRGGGG